MRRLLQAALAVAILATSAPALADIEIHKNFKQADPDDLRGMRVLSGEWSVRKDIGAFPTSAPAGRPAAISLGDFNVKFFDLVSRFTFDTSADEIGVIIGDPNGEGTRPSYYVSLKFYRFGRETGVLTSVGTVPTGFLEGANRSPPMNVGPAQPVPPGQEVIIRIKGPDQWDSFSIYGPGLSVGFDRSMTQPMGKLTFFSFRNDPRTPFGIARFDLTGSGPPVTRSHKNPRLRRHILGLME